VRDWDDAFANMKHVPGSELLPGRWAEQAAAYRAATVPRATVDFGTSLTRTEVSATTTARLCPAMARVSVSGPSVVASSARVIWA
jgi:hypothetical protein